MVWQTILKTVCDTDVIGIPSAIRRDTRKDVDTTYILPATAHVVYREFVARPIAVSHCGAPFYLLCRGLQLSRLGNVRHARRRQIRGGVDFRIEGVAQQVEQGP
jgi:hypothetical protein